ncbi:hypothetical protein AB0D14_16580 [Streptomyces sp. NPDC048484]|uniref:hypothetical protein n=1 Tax=Streptomyces sp. NPDC048484 TaxID=3155146 RepID=UPI003447DFBC
MAPQPVQEVRTEIRLVEDLGYDSLRLIELAIALERAFALPEIGVHRSTTVVSVGDVVDLVRELRTTQS